jgi:hypothetical protein
VTPVEVLLWAAAIAVGSVASIVALFALAAICTAAWIVYALWRIAR